MFDLRVKLKNRLKNLKIKTGIFLAVCMVISPLTVFAEQTQPQTNPTDNIDYSEYDDIDENSGIQTADSAPMINTPSASEIDPTDQLSNGQKTNTNKADLSEILSREQTIENIIKNIPENTNEPLSPTETESVTQNELAVVTQKNTSFQNGDYFWFRRYGFLQTNDQYYYSTILLPGSTIEIRYIDPTTEDWILTTDINRIKDIKTTLYINTDQYNAIVGVAGVYRNNFTNNTLEILPEKESPVVITKAEDGSGFVLSFKFPQDSGNIGEIWCLQSKNELIDWRDSEQFSIWKLHNLSKDRRWSLDGYYFKTPSNYTPTGDNVLYRHPSNYTGSSLSKYPKSLAAVDFGYVMTKVCMKNQNEQGFWSTGPESAWLKSDFEIGRSFYDTRFNTDFAENLLAAYKRYNDLDFLRSALKYAEYFYDHASKNHYEANSGWLVEDYAAGPLQEAYRRTHVSLNHQLAEMNFLYELYNVTNEKKYYDLAEIMLLGIEQTADKWILEDGNLKYALFYEGTGNSMVDYPYLTYNDLYKTKQILNTYSRICETIDNLMSSKKVWMDANGVTEYLK